MMIKLFFFCKFSTYSCKYLFLCFPTYRFSKDQCVLHQVSQLCCSGGDAEQVGCSDARVHRMVQHSEGDAVEAHQVCQNHAISLCVRGEDQSIFRHDRTASANVLKQKVGESSLSVQ